MDNQKDNAFSDKKSNSVELSQKTDNQQSFFKKDDFLAYVFKKTEKLAAAIYMVTNLFSDNEPMKWSLRKKSSDVVSFIITYRNSPTQSNAHDMQGKIFELVSLLNIASVSGLVSNMNFSILKQEFENLSDMFVLRNNSNDIDPGGFRISNSDLEVKKPEVQKDLNRVEHKFLVNEHSSGVKDISIPSGAVFKRNHRQNVIIGLLKKKQNLNVKDIAQNFHDCSEKTIQRELVSLVQNGTLSKTGDRRWTRYSLNQV